MACSEEGLLRHIGLGVNDVQVCLDVLAETELDCLLLAGRYSLIDHSGAGLTLLPLCVQRGVRIAARWRVQLRHSGHRCRAAPASRLRFNYGPATAGLGRPHRGGRNSLRAEFDVPLQGCRAAVSAGACCHRAIVVAGRADGRAVAGQR